MCGEIVGLIEMFSFSVFGFGISGPDICVLGLRSWSARWGWGFSVGLCLGLGLGFVVSLFSGFLG